MNPHDTLTSIENRVRSCQLCALGEMRKNAVPGAGRSDADIMLIGEGPGYHEDEKDRKSVV